MQKFINYVALSVCIDSDKKNVFEQLSGDNFLEDSPSSEILLKINIVDVYCFKKNSSNHIFKHEIKRFGRVGKYFYSLENNQLLITIVLPKYDFGISKLLSSSYNSKTSMILSDFFHGSYLGVIAILLLKRNALLLHSSCINIQDKTYLFIGSAQSGKTTLVRELSRLKDFSVVSEDFIILTELGSVIPLQIPVRIPIRDYLLLGVKVGFLDRINILIFSIFQSLKISTGHRRISFFDYFSKTSRYASPDLHLYYLYRDSGQSPDDVYKKILDIMLSEIHNFAEFDKIIEWLGQKNFFYSQSFDEFFLKQYTSALKNFSVTELHIPYLSDKREMAHKFLHRNIK